MNAAPHAAKSRMTANAAVIRAHRLVRFLTIYSGAFAPEFCGVGGASQRFARAAAILCRRASRSSSLIVFGTPFARRPRACAALFTVPDFQRLGLIGDLDEFDFDQVGLGALGEIGKHTLTVFEAFCAVLVRIGFAAFEGGHDAVDGLVRCHATSINRFTDAVTKNLRLFLGRRFRAGGGGGFETVRSEPRQKSNGESSDSAGGRT